MGPRRYLSPCTGSISFWLTRDIERSSGTILPAANGTPEVSLGIIPQPCGRLAGKRVWSASYSTTLSLQAKDFTEPTAVIVFGYSFNPVSTLYNEYIYIYIYI